jgi:hypothetical protein
MIIIQHPERPRRKSRLCPIEIKKDKEKASVSKVDFYLNN